MSNVSPLRYPGGKTTLYPMVAAILRLNRLERSHYVEPYAGGCGLALSLLYGGHVSDIHINDLDAGIWAFWFSALHETEALVRLIQTAPVTLEEWRKQKEVHAKADLSRPLDLGFATFFLNRTNRSGVIKGAGVIGGFSQKGSYKIDCRFNREDLVRRVRRVSKYKDQIHLSNNDAIEFMRRSGASLPERTFFCIDPPYFKRGPKLYTNFYSPKDHASVANAVLKLSQPWMVTYDAAPEVKILYSQRRHVRLSINYSLQTKRIGVELLISSRGLRLPLTAKRILQDA